jgi:hypothetical protein
MDMDMDMDMDIHLVDELDYSKLTVTSNIQPRSPLARSLPSPTLTIISTGEERWRRGGFFCRQLSMVDVATCSGPFGSKLSFVFECFSKNNIFFYDFNILILKKII